MQFNVETNTNTNKNIKQKNKTYYLLNKTTKYLKYDNAFRSIVNGTAILKLFNDNHLKFDQKIIDSTFTYWGMCEVFERLYNYTNKSESICILCPHYTFGDTQAGCGGKLKKIFINGKWQEEDYSDAIVRKMYEQLHIKAKKQEHVSELKINTHELDSSLNIDENLFTTKIFINHISDCENTNDYNVKINHNKNNHNKDVWNKRVGYIIWGSLHECMDLVSGINMNKNSCHFDDNINGISIVSLKKVMQMATYASKNLTGNIQYQCFPLPFTKFLNNENPKAQYKCSVESNSLSKSQSYAPSPCHSSESLS